MRLSETVAAKVFVEERYDVTLAEFEKLTAANANNVLVLRFLALSYDRLGRYDEAIGVSRKALALSPDNVALLFHSGTTFYNAHYVEDARRGIEPLRAEELNRLLGYFPSGGVPFREAIAAAEALVRRLTAPTGRDVVFEILEGLVLPWNLNSLVGADDIMGVQRAENGDIRPRDISLDAARAVTACGRRTHPPCVRHVKTSNGGDHVQAEWSCNCVWCRFVPDAYGWCIRPVTRTRPSPGDRAI